MCYSSIHCAHCGYYLRAVFISFSTRGGAATVQERLLIKSGIWSSGYGMYVCMFVHAYVEKLFFNANSAIWHKSTNLLLFTRAQDCIYERAEGRGWSPFLKLECSALTFQCGFSVNWLKGAASCPCTCTVVARGSYLRNSCSYLHEAKAIVEVFDRIVYKHTQSASNIKPMKLAKRKVMLFQAIKPTCASELEVQTLKARVSPHREDSNRELLWVPCWFQLQNCCLQC